MSCRTGWSSSGPMRVSRSSTRAAERITGLRAADVVGADVREVAARCRTARATTGGCHRPVGRAGHPDRPARAAAAARRRPRAARHHAATCAPGRGEPVERVLVGLRDTENRRRAEVAQAQLLSTVAHELRSPLTSVKGFSATLLRRWDRFSDDQKRLMLETIEADADRVTRLIGELLDISRIDAGRLEVRRQPVDLVAVASKHVERMVASGYDDDRFVVQRPEAAARGLGRPRPGRPGAGQPARKRRAPRRRHGHADRRARRVDVPTSAAGSERGRGRRRADEGEGIPEDHYPLVFTRFWHGRSRGGTGLGLYVVRGLVEAHGGRISVGRADGGGAMFRFTLPAGAPEHLA